MINQVIDHTMGTAGRKWKTVDVFGEMLLPWERTDFRMMAAYDAI